MGEVDVEPSVGWRTQVPSPWFCPLMKKVVKRVWAVATGASPSVVKARNFMVAEICLFSQGMYKTTGVSMLLLGSL